MILIKYQHLMCWNLLRNMKYISYFISFLDIFLNNSYFIQLRCDLLKSVIRMLNKSALVLVIASHGIGNQPFVRPMWSKTINKQMYPGDHALRSFSETHPFKNKFGTLSIFHFCPRQTFLHWVWCSRQTNFQVFCCFFPYYELLLFHNIVVAVCVFSHRHV